MEAMNTEEVVCAFCSGEGRDPFGIMSRLSSCCVCGGKGAVQVLAPHVRCAHCGGTGAIRTLTCSVCRGKGRLSAPVGPTVLCTVCRGTGDDASEPAMECLRCRGRGWVPKPKTAQSPRRLKKTTTKQRNDI